MIFPRIFKSKKEKTEQPLDTGQRIALPSHEKKISLNAWRVLSRPHVTEKTSVLGERGEYTFEVFAHANKREVAKAVEQMYGVAVVRVHMITIPSKHRRWRGKIGVKPGYKKAIVKVKEGQKIELLPK